MAFTYTINNPDPNFDNLGHSDVFEDLLSTNSGNANLIPSTVSSTSYVIAIGAYLVAFAGSGFTFASGRAVSGTIQSVTLFGAGFTNLTTYDFGTGIDQVALNNALDAVFEVSSVELYLLLSAETSTHFGTSGADYFVGSYFGHDIMIGGNGNDTYVISEVTDVVTEATAGALGGVDTVVFQGTSGTYTLGLNVENLTLGNDVANIAQSIHGIGNNLANVLTGNDEGNALLGLNGIDSLNGGGGIDQLVGGFGSDTYYVDQVGDIVEETSNSLAVGGNDLVYFGSFNGPPATGTYQLTANVERLTLIGDDAINGRGNALANTLTGNGAANQLFGFGGNDIIDGGQGADRLVGGNGNDTYFADTIDDIIIEASPFPTTGGTDAVIFNGTDGVFTLSRFVENLTLAGTDDIGGIGNTSRNTIIGNTGANELNGGFGNDTLTGGAGADVFIFDAAVDAIYNVDTITDFVIVDDTVGLDHTIFAKLGLAIDYLNPLLFKNITLGAVDANDRILYDGATGAISYDTDGSGVIAAIQFATLAGSPTVTADDFFVY